MLKMTRKLQKVLGLVQQKLIIDYNYRLVVSIYNSQEKNRFKSSITRAGTSNNWSRKIAINS